MNMQSSFLHDYSHMEKNNELLRTQNSMLRRSTTRNFRLSIFALIFSGITAMANIYTISQIQSEKGNSVSIDQNQLTDIITAIKSIEIKSNHLAETIEHKNGPKTK